MTTNTDALTKLAAAVEQKRIAQEAIKEAADYLKKLTARRNLCWFVAGLFFFTAGFLTVEVWFGNRTVPVGLISWLGPGLTTFAVLGGISIQKVINRRLIIAKIEQVKSDLGDDIRDHAPADAIELARMVTMLQQVAVAQDKLREGQAKIREDGAKLIEILHARVGDFAAAIHARVAGQIEQIRAEFAARQAAAADELEGTLKQVFAQGYAKAVMDILTDLDARRAGSVRTEGTDGGQPGGGLDTELRAFLAGWLYRDDPPIGADPAS